MASDSWGLQCQTAVAMTVTFPSSQSKNIYSTKLLDNDDSHLQSKWKKTNAMELVANVNNSKLSSPTLKCNKES